MLVHMNAHCYCLLKTILKLDQLKITVLHTEKTQNSNLIQYTVIVAIWRVFAEHVYSGNVTYVDEVLSKPTTVILSNSSK